MWARCLAEWSSRAARSGDRVVDDAWIADCVASEARTVEDWTLILRLREETVAMKSALGEVPWVGQWEDAEVVAYLVL